MKIGFDAKRAFHNNTGLGNYSRTLIDGLARFYPQHQYYLFNPKASSLYRPVFENVHEVRPSRIIDKNLSSWWRSSGVKKDLRRIGIDLYHGLSHEIPFGIEKTKIPCVVTIHDLIIERNPEQFKKIDVQIYRKKYLNACRNANHIIAISNQTRQDIVDFYKIDPSKIDVCYQSCNEIFSSAIGDEEKASVRKQYGLPARFFLSVGSIIERKNLLNVCKAMLQLKDKIKIALVVIGDGGSYKQKVKDFVFENGLDERIVFLSEKEYGKKMSTKELAAIYQLSVAMIYPSFFEGFGLPVLEALWSKTPVITSNVSCLPEAGGEAAFYVDPNSSEEIASALFEIYSDEEVRSGMIEKGWKHAQNFTLQKCTAAVMNVYNRFLDGRFFSKGS